MIDRIKNAVIAAACVSTLASPAMAAELRMLTSWDDTYTIMKDIPQPYVEMVREASGGTIDISSVGPEAVPPFEQLQPVSAGVFDLLFTYGGFHTGATGIGQAADALDPDPDRRRESGAWDWIDRHYQEQHDLKLISLPTATTGFQILLRKPFDEDGSLKGRKIRGTQVYSGVFRLLGASTVVLAPGEVYSALEKGVIDGVGWPSVGAIGFKHYEVAPYIVRPSFGAVSYMLLMNLDAFNRLAAEDRKVLLDQGYELEKRTSALFADLLVKEDAELKKLGAQYISYPDTSLDELNKAFADEAWAIAIKASAASASEFQEFARQQGVTR